MTIREIRTFNSKIRKLERLSEQYLNSKIKTEIENKKLKQELKNTRKALNVAVDALKWIAYDENDEQDGLEEFAISQILEKADEAIKQITALEQK